MPHHVRELTERRELETLSPFAAKAAESRGRLVDEPHDPVRTVYQRDRDRILHSKPFRRLKHKTQVFIDPMGDHYRTRMTHTLEVSQVARTIGRALRLNEDLIEAIALGHDIGHTPFGHAGEHALDEAVREFASAPCRGGDDCPRGFRHDVQSLRIVDHLAKLNLTYETRGGIGGHSKGRGDLSAKDGTPTSTLEASVVRISDRIAYLSHDIEDAQRSGIIDDIPAVFDRLGSNSSQRIGTMVQDVIVHSLDQPNISMSPELLRCMNELKEWMFENVYLLYPTMYPDIPKAQNMVKELFRHFVLPDNLPEGYEGVQGAIDYIAGMTDRFAIETYSRLKLPSAWRLP
ncbi:deoxyguanosinetriphosphate triphosphohydrolase [Fimbriimonas ginsengisoli]|uniref:Deoxyguanosinetriphosphate triphosphohydrolase-like protein n=1 Tax=Fimbriimonas ginsengisoli Gsoil 348 TaxID=661478 RepID=A0A068NUL2_FIMGI|nr:deoxyguanosinetriphosphate triphosphohydrolase [Fimbriimonas ginsengisoli]AIE87223.1 deoxyguanosinetriphosphate triphosphohydrolase-like protein [Fimbriimonas ginsengisoli Gsoil 348]